MTDAADDTVERFTQLKFARAEFTVDLPDDVVKRTSMTDDDVRELIGTENEFTMDWWIRGAEKKLAVLEYLETLVASADRVHPEKAVSRGLGYASSYSLRWPAHEVLIFSLRYERPYRA
jgi:hypothetical protein